VSGSLLRADLRAKFGLTLDAQIDVVQRSASTVDLSGKPTVIGACTTTRRFLAEPVTGP